MRTHVRIKQAGCAFLVALMVLFSGCNQPPSLDEVCRHVSECVDMTEHWQCMDWLGPQVLSDGCYEMLSTVDCDEFDGLPPMPTPWEAAYNEICWPDCNREYSIECFGKFLISCPINWGRWEVIDCLRQCQIWEHDSGTCGKTEQTGTRCICDDE
jgi:hypothetical protein